MKNILLLLVKSILALALNWLLVMVVVIDSLTQPQALERAREIWGASAQIEKVKTGTRLWIFSKFTYQVGCAYQGGFIIAGEGGSWLDAFNVVNMKANGPRLLKAVARDEAGNIGESAPTLVYACNART